MKKLVAAVLLMIVLASGCMGQKIVGNPELLTFIADGQTTRTEILLQLGQPSASLESERILTYRLGGDTQQGYFVRETQRSWSETNYSLVLVFGPDGLLQQHSLVRVR